VCLGEGGGKERGLRVSAVWLCGGGVVVRIVVLGLGAGSARWCGEKSSLVCNPHTCGFFDCVFCFWLMALDSGCWPCCFAPSPNWETWSGLPD